MHTFYRDKSTLFEFKINVEGATLDNTFARVILENNNRKYLFEGKIERGICSIEMPALKEFKETTSETLVVEVVADSTYFIPYEAKYEVKESKRVVVETVTNQEQKAKPKVIVETIQPKGPTEDEKLREGFIELYEKNKTITPLGYTPEKQTLDVVTQLIENNIVKRKDSIKVCYFIETRIKPAMKRSLLKALKFD